MLIQEFLCVLKKPWSMKNKILRVIKKSKYVWCHPLAIFWKYTSYNYIWNCKFVESFICLILRGQYVKIPVHNYYDCCIIRSAFICGFYRKYERQSFRLSHLEISPVCQVRRWRSSGFQKVHHHLLLIMDKLGGICAI